MREHAALVPENVRSPAPHQPATILRRRSLCRLEYFGRQVVFVSRQGGRPPFDPVAMFKILILQVQHNLSDARVEFMIRDRLSWMRFLGFSLGDRTPDEKTIRHFRNRMTETGTLKRVMKASDWQLHKKGYIPMSGQIIDASLVRAPKQRNTDGEQQAIKAGKSAREIWPLPSINSRKGCHEPPI